MHLKLIVKTDFPFQIDEPRFRPTIRDPHFSSSPENFGFDSFAIGQPWGHVTKSEIHANSLSQG